MFAENLKAIMKDKGFTVSSLSRKTGIGKSSISQYLSGKNIPTDERKGVLAEALGVTVDDLNAGGAYPDTIPAADQLNPLPMIRPHKETLTTGEAAALMHKHKSFVRQGLQEGRLPFGYAVKTSGRWSYYISAVKFTEFTGIRV